MVTCTIESHWWYKICASHACKFNPHSSPPWNITLPILLMSKFRSKVVSGRDGISICTWLTLESMCIQDVMLPCSWNRGSGQREIWGVREVCLENLFVYFLSRVYQVKLLHPQIFFFKSLGWYGYYLPRYFTIKEIFKGFFEAWQYFFFAWQ